MKASFVRKDFRSLVSILAILVATASVRADTLVMNSGRRIEGKILKQADDSVTIHVPPGAELRLSKSDIAEVIIVPEPVPVPAAKLAPLTTPAPAHATVPAAPTAPAPPVVAPVVAPPAPASAATTQAAVVTAPPAAKPSPPQEKAPDAPPAALVFQTVSREGALLFPYPKVEGSPAMNALLEHAQGRPVNSAKPYVLNRGDRVEVVLTNTLVYPATPARPETKLDVVQVRLRSAGLVDLRSGRRVQMAVFEGWMLPDRLQAAAP